MTPSWCLTRLSGRRRRSSCWLSGTTPHHPSSTISRDWGMICLWSWINLFTPQTRWMKRAGCWWATSGWRIGYWKHSTILVRWCLMGHPEAFQTRWTWCLHFHVLACQRNANFSSGVPGLDTTPNPRHLNVQEVVQSLWFSENKHLQWRISTSLSERLLVFDFTAEQHVYVLLKMIRKWFIKPVVGDNLKA